MRIRHSKTTNRPGLTTAEVVVSTFLVGLVLVGALNTGGSVVRIWRNSEQRNDGQALAQQLMAEIMSQHYEEPNDPVLFGVELPESTSGRAAWDDVDDYDNWTAAPQDRNGIPMAGYENWSRSVVVEWSQLGSPTLTAGSDEGLKRITVTVTDPAGLTSVLTAYRSRWGGLEAGRADDTTIHTRVDIQIEVNGQTSLQGGVHLPNDAEDDF